jgi:FkbM family methyltransferase
VGFPREVRAFARIAADRRSLLRFGVDAILYRVLALTTLRTKDVQRLVRIRGNVKLFYRLNRGDIQAIREVWLEEIYRLPFELADTRVLVDAGAHIGLASVWLAREYGFSRVFAIEPSAPNARLARLNIQINDVVGEVIEAAIGSHVGMTRFEDDPQSQLGRVSAHGRDVPSLTPERVLDLLPNGVDIDLMKIDIEGAEGELFARDTSWLGKVRSLLIEFHPDRVDYPGLAAVLEQAGFRWFPVGSVFPQTTDAFLRLDIPSTQATTTAET